jgi:hypothetical protein
MSIRHQWVSIFVLGFAVVLAAAPQQQKPSGTLAGAAAAKAKASVDPALAAAAKEFQATGCDASLWKHVYNPQRLIVVEPCISVTGTIHHVKREADGDDHIQLQLDPQYARLLNDRNKTAQADCLILEPICQNPVTQPDAIKACRDFHSPVEVPGGHVHVKVLGSYVLDSEAGNGWMEIHPVTSMVPE